ncbi:glycosyltransferase family 2 protein [Pseudomonas saudiphocaensis]|uniref:glycosyltransferase family 2 protein n=1 Tax=Pseudomonas saudiphocaensis TaxID=1499686 RepID=UPI00187D2843|nr:glycosyltransferase family 2 protein [Pseudomonas saudiphocaensis]MBE7927946.1 glycosyltransferase family 2 protein [Pseudomonas saudiphocaensis]
MEKIYAVILSYKRKDLLKRCLEGVSSQSRSCDGIIVVDNASGDGTLEMLLQLQLSNLHVYELSRNTGASGGFSAGFRIAYQKGADFIWMMDDDVIPEPDALQRLLDARDTLDAREQPYSFLLSTAYTGDGLLTNVPQVDTRTNPIGYENWPALLQFGLVPVRPATYVSILVPRLSLQRHGLPIAAMFMWGDDTEFTLRISQETPGYLVAESRVMHLRSVSGSIDIHRETNPQRIALHRHFVRNELFIARAYHHWRRVPLLFLSRLKLVMRLLWLGQSFKARTVFAGLLEAWKFSPEAEPADAPVEALGVTVRQYFSESTALPKGEALAAEPLET